MWIDNLIKDIRIFKAFVKVLLANSENEFNDDIVKEILKGKSVINLEKDDPNGSFLDSDTDKKILIVPIAKSEPPQLYYTFGSSNKKSPQKYYNNNDDECGLNALELYTP